MNLDAPGGIAPVLIGVITLISLAAIVIPVIFVVRMMRKSGLAGGSGAASAPNGAHGVLVVTGISARPRGTIFANTTITGALSGPGLHAMPVSRMIMAPAAKWPAPGQHLPVVVDPARPFEFTILWDQMPSADEVAWQQAAAMAGQTPGGWQAQSAPGHGAMPQQGFGQAPQANGPVYPPQPDGGRHPWVDPTGT